MTTAQILIGFGLIILLAVGSQVLAGTSHGAAVILGIILVSPGRRFRRGRAARARPARRTAAVRPALGRLIGVPVGGVLGTLSNMRGFDIPARRPFFETLVQLIISALFISISATVALQYPRHLIVPALVLVAALVIVARPVAAFAATLKTDLPKGERAFIGWMAPREIVAAATASTFGAGLAAKGIGGAAKILPATFLVIVATVTLHGLTTAPVVPVPGAPATS